MFVATVAQNISQQ